MAKTLVLALFISSLLFSFSFSQGFGRNIRVIRHYGRFQSSHPLHKDKEMRREMREMHLDDYDPDPKANPRNGPLLNSGSPPPPSFPIHY